MVTFIIAAKNEQEYIADCLKSIYTQQTTSEFEVVVVDNASVDRTAEIVSLNFPKAKVIKENQIGTSSARQRGFVESSGEILVFLDADVRLPDPLWLDRALAKINSDKNIVAISSHYQYYDLSTWLKVWQNVGTFCFVYPWIFLTNTLLRWSAHMIGGMMMVKKKPLEVSGGFDKDINFFGDETIIAARLFCHGRIIVSPSLWVWTSGRRYNKHGMIKTTFKYVWNYFWTLFKKHPFHKGAYDEVR